MASTTILLLGILVSVGDSEALVRQMLEWIAERPRSYEETMDAWRTSCPRLTVWEDATEAGFLRVTNNKVELTRAGRELIAKDL